MDLNAATVMQGLALVGIVAILRWVWKINAKVDRIEGDLEHGFESGRKTMRRHSDKIEAHDDELRALQLAAAETRGREGSNGNLRPHRDRP